jgi:glutaredoxin-related protein
MSCDAFDDVVEALLSEFITPRCGFGDRIVWLLDEIEEREFDALLRQRERVMREMQEVQLEQLNHEVRE